MNIKIVGQFEQVFEHTSWCSRSGEEKVAAPHRNVLSVEEKHWKILKISWEAEIIRVFSLLAGVLETDPPSPRWRVTNECICINFSWITYFCDKWHTVLYMQSRLSGLLFCFCTLMYGSLSHVFPHESESGASWDWVCVFFRVNFFLTYG